MVESRITTTTQSSRERSFNSTSNSQQAERREGTSNAATGVSAASARALGSQMIAFYFRAPAKAFFRTRVDYLAFAKAINPRVQANEAWSFHLSTPGLIGHAVRTYGWNFIPNHVLPPLLANVSVGAVLYTSYLQILGTLHKPSSESTRRVYPPPPFSNTFLAGAAAGAIQSAVAAPLDALQVRFQTIEMLEGRYRDMWQYGRHKLKDIGVRGVLAGWGLSLFRDTAGFAVFFSTFEFVKAQCFYAFTTRYYGGLEPYRIHDTYRRGPDSNGGVKTIRPHYSLEPMFLLLAGISATVAQQAIQHPLSIIQEVHYKRLESLDVLDKVHPSRLQTLNNYRRSYEKTFHECSIQARGVGSWKRWLFRGFIMSTLKQIPSTSAGLVIFELVRRRYADETEAVRIKKDGYDILLT